MIKNFEQFINENQQNRKIKFSDGYDKVFDLINDMKEKMSVDDILSRLISRLSPVDVFNDLKDIYSVNSNSGTRYDLESLDNIEFKSSDGYDKVFDLLYYMKEVISEDDILSGLISRLSPVDVFNSLKDIKSIEIDPYLDLDNEEDVLQLKESSYDKNHNFDRDMHNKDLMDALTNKLNELNDYLNKTIFTLSHIENCVVEDDKIKTKARNVINQLLKINLK